MASFISVLLALALPAAAAPWTTLSGEDSAVAEAQTVEVADLETWKALWERHAAGRPWELPEADFAAERIVAEFGGDEKGEPGQAPRRPFLFTRLPLNAAPGGAGLPSRTSLGLADGRKRLGGFFSGEWYASWGYNQETWAPTDIRVRQPGLGNDFTLHGVKGHDVPGWEKDLLGTPISVPQYQLRVGKFVDKKRTLAVELAFDHTKYSSVLGQEVRVTGTMDGRPVDKTLVLDKDTFNYKLHNGANHLMLNVVKRLPLLGEPGETLSVAGIAKAGVGVMLPHAENTVFGQELDLGEKKFGNWVGKDHGWWQLDGWTAGVEAGLRFTPAKPFYIEVTDKVAYSRMKGVPVAGGTAEHSLMMNMLTASVGMAFGSGAGRRREPCPSPEPKERPKVRVYFGPTRTQYFPTDIRIKTGRVDAALPGVRPVERTSFSYYELNQPEPWRVIDEPTNTLIISYEDPVKDYALSLRYFHPKMLIATPDTRARLTGTIDGKAIDEDVRIGDYFPKWQLTAGFVNIELLAEKMVEVARGKLGTLTYAPGVGVGGYLGYGDVVLKTPWEQGEGQGSRERIEGIGKSVSLSNRLIYTMPNDRLSLSLNHNLTAGTIKYPMLDGHAQQGIHTQTLALQAGFRILPWRKARRP